MKHLKFTKLLWKRDQIDIDCWYAKAPCNVTLHLRPCGNGQDYSVERSSSRYACIRGPNEGLHTLSAVMKWAEDDYHQSLIHRYESHIYWCKEMEEKYGCES